MSKRKSHSLEFKRSVLSWIYKDENNPETSYAAAKKFKADGHIVNKQTIHGWMAKKDLVMETKKKRGKGWTVVVISEFCFFWINWRP
jgi:hypothetical protein